MSVPVLVREEKEPAPAVRASDPMLIEPKLAVMEPPSKIPTVVRDEVKMPVPRVLVVKTSVPSIWYLVLTFSMPLVVVERPPTEM